MHYIIQILSTILIGISIGAIISQRNTLLSIGSLVAIVLAAASLITTSWIPLALGTVVFLVVQGMQRDPSSSQA